MQGTVADRRVCMARMGVNFYEEPAIHLAQTTRLSTTRDGEITDLNPVTVRHGGER